MQHDRSFASEPEDSFEALEAQCKADADETIMKLNTTHPNSMVPNKNPGNIRSTSTFLKNCMQHDRSFASEPEDSFEALEAQCKAEAQEVTMKPNNNTMNPNKIALNTMPGGKSGISMSLKNSMLHDRSIASEPEDSFLALEAQCKSELEHSNTINNSSINKPLLNSTPKNLRFSNNPSATMADSGCGVSARQNNSRKHPGVTLKIITQSNVAASPCCKDAQGKLNHVAAINANKVNNLSKVVDRKANEFRSMLSENLKLGQTNSKLTELSLVAEDKLKRQQTTTNDLQAKLQVLQKKFEAIQEKLQQLEKGGFKYNRQAADHMIDRLVINYDKMLAESDRQQEEITELTNVLELLEKDNDDLSEKLTEMGFEVTCKMSEHSQNDSIFQSMAEENSILEEHINKYQERSIMLENSITRLDSRVENLSVLSNGLAAKNKDLSLEVSQFDKSNADRSIENDTTLSNENTTANDSMAKYADFCTDVASNLQSMVQQQDQRILDLETSIKEAPYKQPRRSI